MELNVADPLWIDVDHPEFGRMAEMCRIVRVGFISHLPGLIFHRRLEVGSTHASFYEKMYKYERLSTRIWLIIWTPAL